MASKKDFPKPYLSFSVLIRRTIGPNSPAGRYWKLGILIQVLKYSETREKVTVLQNNFIVLLWKRRIRALYNNKYCHLLRFQWKQEMSVAKSRDIFVSLFICDLIELEYQAQILGPKWLNRTHHSIYFCVHFLRHLNPWTSQTLGELRVIALNVYITNDTVAPECFGCCYEKSEGQVTNSADTMKNSERSCCLTLCR